MMNCPLVRLIGINVLSIGLALGGCLISSAAMAFDMGRFIALDRSEIRAAEHQLESLLDAHEREPEAESFSAAERYVIERELYWREAAEQAPEQRILEDGTRVIRLHPGASNTTMLTFDDNGNSVMACVAPMHSEQGRTVVRASPGQAGAVR